MRKIRLEMMSVEGSSRWATNCNLLYVIRIYIQTVLTYVGGGIVSVNCNLLIFKLISIPRVIFCYTDTMQGYLLSSFDVIRTIHGFQFSLLVQRRIPFNFNLLPTIYTNLNQTRTLLHLDIYNILNLNRTSKCI